jgi:hypothetical protein
MFSMLGLVFDTGNIAAMTVEKKPVRFPEADVKAGRLISHDAVRRWLPSWGSEKRLPNPWA